MSLSRAFTQRTRRTVKPTDGSAQAPQRSFTTKQQTFPSGTIRNKISAPVELLSTTNMLSYNAPDIYPKSASSSSSSGRPSNSDDDSDRSPTNAESPLTTPEPSSAGSPPSSPEPNHLSCYFGAASGDEAAPKIPQRAPSHTKKNSEILARKRSMRMSNSKNSVSSVHSSPKHSISITRPAANASVPSVRSTAQISTPEALPTEQKEQTEQHPFGKELAKVSEVAERYGITKETLAVVDEEEQELISRGLFKFRAEDYMSEIQGFFQHAFGEVKPAMASSMWI